MIFLASLVGIVLTLIAIAVGILTSPKVPDSLPKGIAIWGIHSAEFGYSVGLAGITEIRRTSDPREFIIVRGETHEILQVHITVIVSLYEVGTPVPTAEDVESEDHTSQNTYH